MALRFDWYPRTPGESVWEDDPRFDAHGRGVIISNMKRDAAEAGIRLKSDVPEAAMVLQVSDVWVITEEAFLHAHSAWVWREAP